MYCNEEETTREELINVEDEEAYDDYRGLIWRLQRFAIYDRCCWWFTCHRVNGDFTPYTCLRAAPRRYVFMEILKNRKFHQGLWGQILKEDCYGVC